jgi:hypothetical protein
MGLMEGDGEEYDYTTSYGDEVSVMVEVYDTHYEVCGYGERRWDGVEGRDTRRVLSCSIPLTVCLWISYARAGEDTTFRDILNQNRCFFNLLIRSLSRPLRGGHWSNDQPVMVLNDSIFLRCATKGVLWNDSLLGKRFPNIPFTSHSFTTSMIGIGSCFGMLIGRKQTLHSSQATNGCKLRGRPPHPVTPD